MSRFDDRTYYSSRADEELEHGDVAATGSVAAVHYELAYRYSMLAFEMNSGRPTSARMAQHSYPLAA